VVAARRLLPLALGLMVTACATPMAMRDIRAIEPNCARIDRQIAMLEHEKAENDQRLIAGVQSVHPALAAISLIRGTYSQNVSIATGEWAASIDGKLTELRRAKRSC